MIEQIINLQEQVEEGQISALETMIELKKVEKVLQAAIKDIKEAAENEAAMYGKGEHELSGAKFTMRSAAGRYDFKHLAWYSQFKQMEADAKEAFKASEKGHQYISNDGEIVEPASYTPGKESLFISI